MKVAGTQNRIIYQGNIFGAENHRGQDDIDLFVGISKHCINGPIEPITTIKQYVAMRASVVIFFFNA